MFEFFSKGTAGLKQDEKQRSGAVRSGEGGSGPAGGAEERLPPPPRAQRDPTAAIAEEHRPGLQAGGFVLGFDQPKSKNPLQLNREWLAGPPCRQHRNPPYSPEELPGEAGLPSGGGAPPFTRGSPPENRKGASQGSAPPARSPGRPYALRLARPEDAAAPTRGPKSPQEAETASPLPLFARISELEHALKAEKRLRLASAERLAKCEERLKLQTAKLEESLGAREESRARQEEANTTILGLQDELCRLRAAFEGLPKTGNDKLGLMAQLAICRAGADHCRAQMSRLATENKELSALVSTQRKALGLQEQKVTECLGEIAALSTRIAEILQKRLDEDKKFVLDWQRSAISAVNEAKTRLDCD